MYVFLFFFQRVYHEVQKWEAFVIMSLTICVTFCISVVFFHQVSFLKCYLRSLGSCVFCVLYTVCCSALLVCTKHTPWLELWKLTANPFVFLSGAQDIFLRWLFLQKLRDHASFRNKEGKIKSIEWGLETEKDALRYARERRCVWV